MPLVGDDQIKDMLADGRITAITVDTSIFDQKRLQLNSAVMQSFAALKGKPFSYILSGTVAKEVLAHLEKAATDALLSAKKSIGHALFAFGTSNQTRDEILAEISGGRTPVQASRERWGQYLHATGCEVLVDADLVDTRTIYDAYFAGDPPFGSGRKKDEFPDALALNALERTAADRDTAILVVSKDGDWKAYCEKSKRLYLVPKIEHAMNLITNAPLGLRKAIAGWLSDEGDGIAEIRQHLKYNVEQIEFTANAHATHGEVELSAWAGELQDVTWPDPSDIDIIDILASDEPNVLRVVISFPVYLVVRVLVEMDFSFWDGVDKESVGMGGRSVEVDEELDERATVTVDVHDLGSEDEILEFVESELEAKYHEIDLGEVDVFEPEDYWDGEEAP